MMASVSVSVPRPAAVQARAFSTRPARPATPMVARRVAVRATPASQEKSSVEKAINDAKERCEEGTAGECAAAWDEVEELSAAAAHAKVAKGSDDPLEKYCDDNPEADECRVYED